MLKVQNRVAVIVAVGLLSAAAMFQDPFKEGIVHAVSFFILMAGILWDEVASSFMGLFDVVFDTLIFCWLTDLQPTQGVVFAAWF